MLAAWLAVVTLLVGAGAPRPVAAQPAGTLVVGLVAEPVNLDPAQVTDLNSNRVGRRIVETLVTFPDESTQIVPGLAESWTVSKDGLHYVFKLRKSVTFHDGTPLNAEAVKFSIERQINPEHPAAKIGKYPFANYFFGNVKAVEVLDSLTVEFVLKEPRASFLAVLTAGYRKCEQAVIDQCRELLQSRLEYVAQDGESFLDAAQNARQLCPRTGTIGDVERKIVIFQVPDTAPRSRLTLWRLTMLLSDLLPVQYMASTEQVAISTSSLTSIRPWTRRAR